MRLSRQWCSRPWFIGPGLVVIDFRVNLTESSASKVLQILLCPSVWGKAVPCTEQPGSDTPCAGAALQGLFFHSLLPGKHSLQLYCLSPALQHAWASASPPGRQQCRQAGREHSPAVITGRQKKQLLAVSCAQLFTAQDTETQRFCRVSLDIQVPRGPDCAMPDLPGADRLPQGETHPPA